MSAITLTLGDVSENHVGMVKQGTLAPRGFSNEDLTQIFEKLQNSYCFLIRLDLLAEPIEPEREPASILIVKNGLQELLGIPNFADNLLEEQGTLNYDKKALVRGRVINKTSRYNLCFSKESKDPDIEKGQGTVVAYDSVPHLKTLVSKLPDFLGESFSNLETEANLYYDITRCGINFHGDKERKKVFAVRLGESIPLYFQWYYKNQQLGKLIDIEDIIEGPLEHGDIYIMSEKAVGNDWLNPDIPTLRHAAGSVNF